MKKIYIVIAIIFPFLIGIYIGYEIKNQNYISKETAEKELAVIDPSFALAPKKKYKEAAYLDKSVARKKVFGGSTIDSFQTQGKIAPRYKEPNLPEGKRDEVYLEYWASPNTIKSIRLRQPLFDNNKIPITIQTYTWAETGGRYGIDNFQIVGKPLKLKSGLYAYFSRYNPPTAFIAPPDDDRFIVITADNTKILLRALNNLVIP